IGASKRIFHRCFAPKIRERRVCAGIAHAEMDDAAHLSAGRGAEEAATALDRLGEGRATVLEAHPIRVEERLTASRAVRRAGAPPAVTSGCFEKTPVLSRWSTTVFLPLPGR